MEAAIAALEDTHVIALLAILANYANNVRKYLKFPQFISYNFDML